MNPRLLVTPLVVLAALAWNAAAQTPPASPAPKDANAEALRILRATIAEQTRNPDKVIRTPDEDLPVSKPAPKTPRDAAAADLEQRYLAGKISQREYEKALARLNPPAPAGTNALPAKPTAKASKVTSPRDTSGPPPALEPAFPTPPPQPTERQKKISEVEGKLDDMIRAKEARERAAQTNAPTGAPGQKLSKRERLDFLLRQVVQGKLSDEEYKKERERIMAEPE